MSNSLAIAAVTATLRNLLMGVTNDLPDATVTIKPPRKARSDQDSGNQLNLFLYQTAPNAVWQRKQGSSQSDLEQIELPPLALNLYYLITAYGRNDDSLLSHRLLGDAMCILHDHTVLTTEEIAAALPGNNLHEQVEQIRITPHPLTPEDLSRLWAIFQTPYEISTAYQVSVVLITTPQALATKPNRAASSLSQSFAIPFSQTPPFPILSALQLPKQQVSVQAGDVVSIQGHNLSGDKVAVQFKSLRFPDTPLTVAPLEATATTIKVQMPIAGSSIEWGPGFWTIAAVITQVGKPAQRTNELPFALASQIQAIAPNPVILNAQGELTLTVTINPVVLPEQEAWLLLGDRKLPAQQRIETSATLTFSVTNLLPGEYPMILRIDGVDSLPGSIVAIQNSTGEPQEPELAGGQLHA